MTSPSTSPSLLLRLQQLNPRAWERFCALYGPVVYGWCRRTGLQEDDSADILQEVFQSVYQQFDQYRGENFRGWLWSITINRVRQFFREMKNRATAPGGTDGQINLALISGTDFSQIESDSTAERREILHRALNLVQDDFSPQTWAIFKRTTLENQSVADVAADLSMSTNAVRQARFRVLRRLREELDGLI